MEYPTLELLRERAVKMRLSPTKSELDFSQRLTNANIPFHQQYIIAPYIADFLIGNTIIEIDGAIHENQKLYDARRDRFLRKAGYRVIRIPIQDVHRFNLTILKKSKNKKVKKKPLSEWKRKCQDRRARQRKQFEREAEIFEMIKLPNGDFKRVLKSKVAA